MKPSALPWGEYFVIFSLFGHPPGIVAHVDRPENTNSNATTASIPRRGYLYVAAAALMWAVSGSSAKHLFAHGVTPLQLTQLRLTIGIPLLFLWLVAHRPALLRIAYRDILYFALLGATGLAMVQFTYLLTISKLKVAVAILMQYLAPVLIVLYSLLFARETLTRVTVFAVCCATIGCYLVVGGYNLDLFSLNREGVLCGFTCAVAFAWYSLYGEKGMRRYPPWTVLFYAILFAAIFWNSVHPLWEAAPRPFEAFGQTYSPGDWGLILYIAILGTIVPFGLYFDGISLIRSTRASITATLEPISAGIISFFFLGETLEPLQVLGMVLVIAAVILLQLRREVDYRTPAVIRSRLTSPEGRGS
jgi:drug/metabolite transporter, DME family